MKLLSVNYLSEVVEQTNLLALNEQMKMSNS